jgi:Co/Zn/Cd efflux system component
MEHRSMSAHCCEHEPAAPLSRAVEPGYRRALWLALAINFAMFGAEIVASFVAGSVSVLADALDFLGDGANYGLALAVAGLPLAWRARTALLKGAVMALFGLWVAASTVRHAIDGTLPEAEIMGGIGLVAFAANLVVAALLFRHRGNDSQALSVWLCTRNDCIANVAVMLAGAGVWASGTHWPDVAVAAVIAALGLSSAAQVLGAAAKELRTVRAVAAE